MVEVSDYPQNDPYQKIIQYLESLSVMPKTMPGLDKIRRAVAEKSWFASLNPKTIITVAGTNGKGTTCAVLESLLLSAGKSVGLYTSPHLVKTTERMRINQVDISEKEFVQVFERNKDLIQKYELTHFESLTLMAADYFYSQEFFSQTLDYVIWEVGLGGTFDATNVFPNHYAAITQLGLDHTNILGKTLDEVAANKFGIIKKNGIVVHLPLPEELNNLQKDTQQLTQSEWFAAPLYPFKVKTDGNEPRWMMQTSWGEVPLNLFGKRAVENAGTALQLFEKMGFAPQKHLGALNQVRWSGRMQKIAWPENRNTQLKCPIYLSGDHNPQGVGSLLEILKYFQWQTLHVIVGIGQDKDCAEMLSQLLTLPRIKIYLTETPFKGRKISEYPASIKAISAVQNADIGGILDTLQTNSQDLVLVTGSLYLVGQVLSLL